MASLGGVSSSNTMSSLMNSANMISGLASGLDTESMIENLVKSYQTKISQLNQKATKVEWKQESYRSIIQKLVGLSSKYTSYNSSSNLTSPSFFNSSVKVDPLGVFADRVSASGKTSSEISLDRVTQLATSAQYRTGSSMYKAEDGIKASEAIDLNGRTPLSALNGSLTVTYGDKKVSIRFDQVKDVEAINEIKENNAGISDQEALGKLIERKLADQEITFSGGKTETADKRIGVEVLGGTISFYERGNAGNGLYISSASKDVASALGLDLSNAKEDKITSFDAPDKLVNNMSLEGYLAGETMNLTLDGVTKQIELPSVAMGMLFDADGNQLRDENGDPLEYNAKDYTKALNMAVQKAFGRNKIEVENVSEDPKKLQLNFKVQEGSELVINSDVGKALGIGQTATSYLNTNQTLKELLGDKLKNLSPAKVEDEFGVEVLDVDEKTGKYKYEFKINDVVVGKYTEDAKLSDIMADINSNKQAGVSVSYSQTTKNFLFKSKDTGAQSEIKIGGGLAETMFGSTEIADNSGGSFAESYGLSGLRDGETASLKVTMPNGGGETAFNITKETSMQEVADKLNDAFQQQYSFSYNKYSGQIEAKDLKSGERTEFGMKATVGGRDKDVEFDPSKAPTVNYTTGQDAKFTVTVNGETKNMTRSSNSVTIDGLTITMKDTFDGYKSEDGKEEAIDGAGKPKNAITFETRTDSDKIVETIKGLIDEYNAVMAEVKSAYTTLPYRKSSNGSFSNYEPLTDEEREGMTESAIKSYEEKAKQGILFNDRNLSALYDKMRNVFAGSNEAALRSMGITISYSITDGVQAVTLDESKLRATLDSDPDLVTETFTGEKGVMQSMKTQLDAYARTTGVPKGILIEQAGSPLSSLSLMDNTWQREIDNLNTQIEKWQDKLTSQVERYTSQFSRLEVLINQMNSQSSTLAGLMGGG